MTKEDLKVWEIKNPDGKLGTVYQMEKGYIVAHQGQTNYFTTKKKLQDYVNTIQGGQMVPMVFKHSTQPQDQTVFDYPVKGKTYNHLLHVKHRAPVYTKEPNSKCFFAAGWYAVNVDGEWSVEFCPKLLVINRNEYQGPFKHESEARTAAGKP